MTAARNPLDELAAKRGAARPVIDKTINHEAERAVIAALMRNPDGKEIIRLGIAADLFDHPPDREAFAAIASFIADGIPPDAATLRGAVGNAALIEVETSLQEHASAANLPVYVNLLKACQREREIEAARERLANAVKGDASDDEITRLSGELRLLRSGQPGNAPPLRRLDLAQLEEACLTPKCIVENYLYADVALVAGAGGTGKTTTLLYEAVQIALGRTLWGCRVVNPGGTLFVTAEDSTDVLGARLREIMVALNLSRSDREIVLRSIPIVDLTADVQRLAELDAKGNITLTSLADSMVQSYQNEGLVQVIFDPAVSFGPGERLVNDGEQALITACRRIRKGLNCCVRLNHHTGKANARNGAIDQYAARGGSALPDGSRMVAILSSVDENGHCAAVKPNGFELRPDESGFILARAKLSYAPPQPNIWIRRRGFAFDYAIETRQGADEARELDARKVADFLADELHHGRRYTARALEDLGSLKLSRSRLRSALARLDAKGCLEERELPSSERRGKRKTYLHVAAIAQPMDGAIDQNSAVPSPLPAPIAPPESIAPPYREKENGAIDRRFSFSTSLNAPPNNGAIAAQWRNSDVIPSARVCASSETNAEPAQPTQAPQPYARVLSHRGVGINARAQIDETSNSRNPDEPPATNTPDSPLARRILAALDGCPGGIARADLLRIVGNGKGASPAMIEAEVNALLVKRRIATVNDRLVLEAQP